ncbi:MAG TPA: hypothetical protein VK811_03525, partial [Candidatus Acidoferrum sp.]|nr:hypothetical protein [Candidatus Acidoferrum sp.]
MKNTLSATLAIALTVFLLASCATNESSVVPAKTELPKTSEIGSIYKTNYASYVVVSNIINVTNVFNITNYTNLTNFTNEINLNNSHITSIKNTTNVVNEYSVTQRELHDSPAPKADNRAVPENTS